MQTPTVSPAIAPVTPAAPAQQTASNGAFSRALDQAAQRRAEDKPKSKDSQPSKDAKPAQANSNDKAETASGDDPLDADNPKMAGAAQPADATLDPLLAAALPVRSEIGPIGLPGAATPAETKFSDVDGAADSESSHFTNQLGRAPSASAQPANPISSAPDTAAARTSAPTAGDVATQALAEPGNEAASVPRDAALPMPVITYMAPGSQLTGGSAAAPTASALATAEAHVQARLDSPNFGAAFGAQLSIMAREGVKEARLHLNPAEMGPVTVQITVTGQIARVDMVAEAALTRQVLEQSMPSLASALRESGLTLAGGGVFEQPRQPGQDEAAGGKGQTAPGPGTGPAEDESGLLAAASAHGLSRASARGVVDLYA